MYGIAIICLCQELMRFSLSVFHSLSLSSTSIFIHSSWTSHMLLKFVFVGYAGSAGIPFFPFVFPILCSLGNACTTYPHLDEEDHLEYPLALERFAIVVNYE